VGIAALLVTSLAIMVAVRAFGPQPTAEPEELSAPPDTATLRVLGAGDETSMAYGFALRLQAFDNQPGVSIPFARLDYAAVRAWLGTMLKLDPATQYPLLMATHLYGQVLTRPDKQREMAEFVYQRFLEQPDTRWPWVAHMAIMAKHRLRDPQLAIRYADGIRDHARGSLVPSWARQMHIFLREDVGEIESARALLGGLLDSGAITDPQEFAFLQSRLRAMESVGKSSAPTK
jgi:hypothetical protein